MNQTNTKKIFPKFCCYAGCVFWNNDYEIITKHFQEQHIKKNNN